MKEIIELIIEFKSEIIELFFALAAIYYFFIGNGSKE